jgi:hypothetical protein
LIFTYVLVLASSLVIACTTGEDDEQNTNTNGPVVTKYSEYWVESVTYDASSHSIEVRGLYRPSPDLEAVCVGEPAWLSASEVVHKVPLEETLWPGTKPLRMPVQYEAATPISTSELERRIEQVPILGDGHGNVIDFDVDQQGVGHVWASESWFEYDLKDGNSRIGCGSVMIFYEDETIFSDGVGLFCGACGARGTCGDGWCDPGEPEECDYSSGPAWDCLPACAPSCTAEDIGRK